METRARIAVSYNLETDDINAESLKTVREKHLEKLTNEKEYVIETTNKTDLSQLQKNIHFLQFITNN
ncbi:MAG: hypothetical protein R2822_25050 [Spirosomataceae bacterium]